MASIILYCTAGALRAMLEFIDPKFGPRIAADDDSLADALVKKVKEAVGDAHGITEITISFGPSEKKLVRQFFKVAKNCSKVFSTIAAATEPYFGKK